MPQVILALSHYCLFNNLNWFQNCIMYLIKWNNGRKMEIEFQFTIF